MSVEWVPNATIANNLGLLKVIENSSQPVGDDIFY